MTPACAPSRLAIAQIAMHWTVGDNLRAMKEALHIAQREGAALCAFSELALTGFHRRIVEWARPEVSLPAVAEVQAICRDVGVAAVLGAPTYRSDGARLNSHLFIDATGSLVGTVSKIGLTAPEATFFAPGTERPMVSLLGRRCTAVICREIEDLDTVVPDLVPSRPEWIFWPGLMSPDRTRPMIGSEQPVPEFIAQAQALARGVGAFVIQTNWPNALNRPEESVNLGLSACIDPEGRLLFRLPQDQSGVGVFDLGASQFDWHPCPLAPTPTGGGASDGGASDGGMA
ncbi:MAG: carbon-nitrogen hydrolase family protein [Rubrivivax sp.]